MKHQDTFLDRKWIGLEKSKYVFNLEKKDQNNKQISFLEVEGKMIKDHNNKAKAKQDFISEIILRKI